jgi:hypothetical protein
VVSHKPKNDSVQNTHQEAVFSKELPIIGLYLLLRFTVEASSMNEAIPALDKVPPLLIVEV